MKVSPYRIVTCALSLYNCLKSHVSINKTICIHKFHLLQEIARRPFTLSRYVWERNYLHSAVMIIIYHVKIIFEASAWPTFFINACIYYFMNRRFICNSSYMYFPSTAQFHTNFPSLHMGRTTFQYSWSELYELQHK